MYTWTPSPRPDVLILCDTRMLSDAHRDAENSPPPGSQSVLQNWPWGREVWGWGWKKVARAALFEFNQDVDAKARAQVKRDLRDLLVRLQPKRIVVLQSRSKRARKVYDDNYAQGKHSGTIAWGFFDPPDNISGSKDSPGMAGSFWDTPYGVVVGCLNHQNTDFVEGDSVYKWLSWCKDLESIVLPDPNTTASEPGPHQRAVLDRLAHEVLQGARMTFDLEFIPSKKIITCMGLSSCGYTVSIPWEPFVPAGQAYTEPGFHLAPEGDLVRELFRKARVVVGHNIHGADLPFLRAKGIEVGGRPFDTFLAHGATLNQFRHSLQTVVVRELVVPPWKTLHRAAAKQYGMDPDVDERAWYTDPAELRRYNVQDSFYNDLIAPPFAERVGIEL